MSSTHEPGELDFNGVRNYLSDKKNNVIWATSYYFSPFKESVYIEFKVHCDNDCLLEYEYPNSYFLYPHGKKHDRGLSFDYYKFFENYWCAWAYCQRMNSKESV